MPLTSVWSSRLVNLTRSQHSRESQSPWVRGAKYGAVGIELPPSQSSTQSQSQGISKAIEKAEDKSIALNSTQAIVIALANLLPKATYHVFFDNLFLLSYLLCSLRKNGHGATGTARTNSGIHIDLIRDKDHDGKVKGSYEFNAVKAIPTHDNLVLTHDTFSGADDGRVWRERKRPSSRKAEAKTIGCFLMRKLSKM